MHGTAIVGAGNPKLVNYPLPINLTGARLSLDRLAMSKDMTFHLQFRLTLPAGKGHTTFPIAKTTIPIDCQLVAPRPKPSGLRSAANKQKAPNEQ